MTPLRPNADKAQTAAWAERLYRAHGIVTTFAASPLVTAEEARAVRDNTVTHQPDPIQHARNLGEL